MGYGSYELYFCVEFFFLPSVYPSQPTSFKVKSKTRNTVTLSWKQPNLKDLTKHMLEYLLECSHNNFIPGTLIYIANFLSDCIIFIHLLQCSFVFHFTCRLLLNPSGQNRQKSSVKECVFVNSALTTG